MRRLAALALASLAGLGLLAGCATSKPALTLPAIGPVSGGRANWVGSANGYLRVYTATEDFTSGGLTYQVPKAYWVYTPEGKQVRGIPNRVGIQDQHPLSVSLPPGRYVVHAPSQNYGLVRVPLLILPTRLTLVYLEGRGLPEAAALPPEEVVRLPDGTPVGRRAPEPLPAKTP
jgi:hypothetical protein